MPSRVLETVLTGRNLLSPVLTAAGRDVEQFNDRVEDANRGAAAAATAAADASGRAADRVVESNAKIGRSSTDAADQIQKLRRELTELGATTAKPDVDTTVARTKLDDLRIRLAEVAAADPTAQIDVDVTEASAQIRMIQMELDRVSRTRAEPNVKLSAEEAQAKIQAVLDGLRELGAQQANASADVDTADARMRLAELRAELAEVAASNPSARVSAQTDVAEAQLRAIQSQLNSIDGRSVTATVNVRTNNSGDSGSGGGLGKLAMGLSPALIPLGAVAGAGALAAGAGAAATLPALGAAALGYANVADAVKLLNNQQTQSTLDGQKAATQAASTAAAQSSAARQVQSSEAALANARANADDANVRAAGQVAKARQSLAQAEVDARQGVQDAEASATKDVTAAVKHEQDAQRDLASAQRDTRQAVTDLTAAEKTAQQQFEDTANSVADNTLSQRQAVLDLADAEKELETARASGDPDQIARATLAYDQQVQRQKELVLQGQRLQAQQDENTRTGVEGSATVVAAQQRVIDARVKETEAARNASNAAELIDEARADGARDVAKAQQEGAQKVAAAQQTVSDAVQAQATQQRQSAYSIQQAQAQVAAAHQAAAAAAVKADDDTSSSMARINEQLAQLNPATVAFAGYVQTKLAPAWQALQQANAGELLPRTQQALDILMTKMPQVTGFTTAFSRELGNLEVDAARALTGPFWARFFDDVQNRGVPILDDFAHSAGNVIQGGAGIVQAFLPMGTDVAGGIETASKKFSDWGQNLKNSEGFRQFSDYVHREWPVVKDVVENVANAVTHLVEAGAPIGSTYLQALQLLTGLLSGLPVGTVNALLTAFLAFKIGGAAADGLANLTKGAGGLAKSLESISGGNEKIGGIVSSIGKFGSALPVVGLGIGLVTAAVTAVTSAQQAHAQAVKEDTDNIARLYQQQASGAANASSATSDLAAKQRELNGEQQKLADMQRQFDENPYKGSTGIGQLAAIDQQKAKIGELTAALDNGKKKYEETLAAMSPVERAQTELNTAIQLYGPTSDQAAAAAGRYREAQGQAKQGQDDFNRAIETTLQLHQQQAAAALGLVNSNLGSMAAQQNFTAAVQQYSDHAKAGASSSSQLAQEQTSLAQSAIQAAQAAGQAAADQAKQNGATDTATISQQAMLDSLKKNADHLTGPGRDAVLDYMKQLEQNTTAADIGAERIENLGLKVIGLPDGHHIEIDVPTGPQMQVLQDLGVKTTTLPNGHIVVDADTLPAKQQMDYLLDAYKNYSININPQGMAVTTEQRNKLYGADGGIVHMYADGGIERMGGDIAQVVRPGTLRVIGDNPIADEAFIPLNSSARSYSILDEAAQRMGRQVVPMADGGLFDMHATVPAALSQDYMDAVVDKLLQRVGAGGPSGGTGVERWRALVVQALGMVGEPSSLANVVLRRMNQESGGNPRAINNWDINAKRGTPSKGLMQVIDPTFRANAYPGYSSDIWDPLSNILASMEYAERRYGSLASAYNRSGGYDSGGIANGIGVMPKNTLQPERVLSPQQTQAFEQWMTSPAAMPGYGPPASGTTTATPTPVIVSFDKARITGRLEMGTDGLVTLVGELIDANDQATFNDVHYAGG